MVQRILPIALAFILLVACGPAPAVSGLLSGVQPLQPLVLWHALSPQATETLLEQVEQFNAYNPWGIRLAVERLSTPAALRAQLKAAAVRGRLPDLALLDPADLGELLNTGGLVDLHPYADDPQEGLDRADRDDLLPLFFGDGATPWVGAPAYLHLFVLYYNVDWLAQLDAAPPSNWEEFRQLCLTAVATTNALNHVGYVYAENEALFLSWLWSRGGDAFSYDGRHVAFSSQAGLDAFTLINELVKSGCAYVGDSATARNDFAHGRTLFTFASTAELEDYAKAIKDAGILNRWAIAAPPHTTEQPVVVASGPHWTIWRTTPERQRAAWRVICWFTSPATSASWTYRLHALPVRASAARALSATLIDNRPMRTALDLLTVARSEPIQPGWDDVRRLMAQALTQAAHGVPPERALNDAADLAERLLSPR